MFGRKKKPTAPSVKLKVTERNIIAKKTKITGEIESEGDFRIDGFLEGTLKTKGRVILGLEGVINGTVEAQNADLEGKIIGTLIVKDLLSVKSTADVSGEIVTRQLSVEPGAKFNANFSIKKNNGNDNEKINKFTIAEKKINK